MSFNALLELVKSNPFFSGGLGLMVTGSFGYVVRKIPAVVYSAFLRHCTVVLDAQSTDTAYHWLLVWLSSQPYSQRARRISMKHIRSNGGLWQFIALPARGSHWFFYKGKPVWVERAKDSQAPASAGTDIIEALTAKETISIRTLGRSRQELDTIITEAKDIFESLDKNVTRVYRYCWGTWVLTRKMKRPIESVYLPPEASDLVEDVQRFLSAKEWYREMGIPYKRGYLFHGPPGTGKSSTVEVLAGHLDLPIYVINLATMGDETLERAIGGMNNDRSSILLIEDIDTALPNRDAQEAPAKRFLSLGTLLNVIDGMQAADDVLLVMTTNRPEVLDAALTRPGRIDRRIEFGLATPEQIALAIRRFLGTPTFQQRVAIAQWPHAISMAEVQERLKRLVLGSEVEDQREVECA